MAPIRSDWWARNHALTATMLRKHPPVLAGLPLPGSPAYLVLVDVDERGPVALVALRARWCPRPYSWGALRETMRRLVAAGHVKRTARGSYDVDTTGAWYIGFHRYLSQEPV